MKKLISLFFFGGLSLMASSLYAESHVVNEAAGSLVTAYRSLAAALGAAITIGIAVVGGALSQGKAIKAALDSIGRNPAAADKIFVPMIIGLALIESLVIYALLIAFMLLGKI